MVAHTAPVLNHDFACGLRLLRGVIVANSELHPDDPGGALDRLVHDWWNVGRGTEDIEGIEWDRSGIEGGERLLPDDIGRCRVHRVDAVAVPLHVFWSSMLVLRWVLRAAHDR